ncbi:MAG: DUF2079 domain-containing protein, partial [Planctomycetota bacterium]|nr:DUF2079 domain-containing protein [Planctomycetota bacterium]
GSAVLGFHISEILAERSLATTVISTGLWTALVDEVGGKVVTRGDRVFAELDAMPIVGGTAAVGVCLWLVGSSLLMMVSRKRWTRSLAEFGKWGWLWWLTPIVFGLLDFAGTTGWLGTEFPTLLRGTLPFWNAALFAGWGATWIALAVPDVPAEKPALTSPSTIPAAVWGAMTVFTVAFGWMNWRLYDALLLPHGDSAMYEEHLWNLLHGKGFRSYLDNGRLFLGEHVQVVHLLLMPLYLLWPSHVLLELCQTLALAAGAIPVYRLAFRATDSRRAGCLLALTYLLYFPMQFLDIAIDFKTFRPNGFEIPFLLFALDAMESRRLRGMWVWLLLALSCQEDAATVIAPLGLWIACCPPGKELPDGGVTQQRARWSGWALAAGGTLWVLLVIKVILPWFRGGADVHFAQ